MRSPEEVLRVLKKGENNRRSGATDWVSVSRLYASEARLPRWTERRSILMQNNVDVRILERKEFQISLCVYDHYRISSKGGSS